MSDRRSRRLCVPACVGAGASSLGSDACVLVCVCVSGKRYLVPSTPPPPFPVIWLSLLIASGPFHQLCLQAHWQLLSRIQNLGMYALAGAPRFPLHRNATVCSVASQSKSQALLLHQQRSTFAIFLFPISLPMPMNRFPPTYYLHRPPLCCPHIAASRRAGLPFPGVADSLIHSSQHL